VKGQRTLSLVLALVTAGLVGGVLFLGQQVTDDPGLEVLVLTRNVGAGERHTPHHYRIVRRQDTTVRTAASEGGVLTPQLLEQGANGAPAQQLAFWNLEFRQGMMAGSVVDYSLHLGHRLPLAPHQRGVALEINRITGVEGFLRRGELVSVVATIRLENDRENNAYAKMLFEDLPVLFVSPGFTRIFVDPPPVAADSAEDAEEEEPAAQGVVIVAATINPIPLIYKSDSTMAYEWVEYQARQRGDVDEEGFALSNPFAPQSAVVQFGSQVEILAMLQRADGQFALMLQPQTGRASFETPGYSLGTLIAPLVVREERIAAELEAQRTETEEEPP